MAASSVVSGRFSLESGPVQNKGQIHMDLMSFALAGTVASVMA